MIKRIALALGIAVMATTVSACGPDYTDLPLPGSEVPGDTYSLTATFDEALNLAQGALVKVNGVPVGRVQDVTAKDFQAVVAMDIESDLQLRQGSTARLRYDTPLGELFIQIDPAKTGAPLEDNDSLTDEQTTTAPTVENTLAQASLLINGGGLGQLQTITDELNTALGGREDTVRRLLARANTFLASANDSTGDIDRVLRSLSRASQVLAAREETINRAVTDLRPVSEVLRDNTDEIVDLLDRADNLTVTATRTLRSSRTELLQVLRQIDPIVQQLLATKPQLAPGLTNLISATKLLQEAAPGDFLPFDGRLVINESILNTLLTGEGVNGGTQPGGGGGGNGPIPPLPNLPLPNLPDLPLPSLPDLGLGGLIPGLGLRAMVPGGGTR